MTEQETAARRLLEAGILDLDQGRVCWDGAAALMPPARDWLLEGLLGMIAEHYSASQALLGGQWAALAAARLGLPLNPEQIPARSLLVVDAVENAGPLLELALPLREQGVSVAVAAIFNYGGEAVRKPLDKADIRLHWLTDLETAAGLALQQGRLDLEDYDLLLSNL